MTIELQIAVTILASLVGVWLAFIWNIVYFEYIIL